MTEQSAARLPWTVRAPILLLAAAPRIWAAFADQGLFWPDEFYQSIEPAHRFAFGYGLVPWEFATGARSWLFPGLIGLWWKLLSAIGLGSAPTLIVTAKLLMCLIAIAGVDLAMRFSFRLAGTAAAAIGGLLAALFPALVLFGSKCMTEIPSATLLLAASYLLLPGFEGRASQRRAGWAGALIALSIFVRYQNGVALIGLFLVIASYKRWRDLVWYTSAATVVGIAGGLLDLATWGRPFHSFLKYAQFHAENGSAPWGSSPSDYYVHYTWRSAGPVCILVVVGLVVALPVAWRYIAVGLVFFAIHSYVPHKEYRYITPAVPLLLALSAVGLKRGIAWLVHEIEPRLPASTSALQEPIAIGALCVGIIAGFGQRAVTMTFDDLGHGDGLAAGLAFGGDSPWHAAEGINRMLWEAGARADLCGVVVKDIPWSSTGGFAYLHRDVPMLFRYSTRNLESANYLIARREFQQPAQFKEGPESRGFMLFHRDGPCAPPPAGYTRMVPP